ncbi:hypothetical protein CMV_024381 [Castanea mollissima]|uniref:Leucine-rich repeat-containing N-terminal plant-type domain-containing protein n=1 Tax=Castanea mollissima TaxID=60419 RepID=A0A8J4QFP3_9ROSI|nr:hypothetical protein CMV_024381 [Castanea mollissima]
MGRLTRKYQVLCLLSLLFLHSPLSFSSFLSSNSQCSALLQFSNSLSLNSSASPPFFSRSGLDFIGVDVHLCDISYPKTASWKEDKHCCSWDGVECDKNTGHVIGLDLSCSRLKGTIHSNSTLFLLRHLRTLNLAGNDFYPSLLSSEFGQFRSLTHLNLSRSRFAGQIPYVISQLSSLVSLDLSYNHELSFEKPVWNNLTLFRELRLDWIDMSSIRPKSLMNLSSSLTTLSLHHCNLRGKLENSILLLPSLQTLDLGFNTYLSVSLPKSNWSSSSLKLLDLSRALFSEKLPDSISNLKSLKYLSLSFCDFSRSIPTSLGNLTQITHLDLSRNELSSVIPTWLESLTNLTILDLSFNSFNGLLPSSLLNLPNLSTLHLDYNQLVGPLPNYVSGLNLTYLSLRSNFLNGTLPSWLFSLPSLVWLDISSNQFIGEIGEFKSNSLEELDLGYNKLQGSIPKSISRLVNLTSLSLSSNNLSIMLDFEKFSKFKNLKDLDLSSNSVSINNNVTYTLPFLRQLNLSSSNINEFPIFLRAATNLEYLDLSNNNIYDQAPRWLGDMGRDSLYFLDLSHNLFQGPFPTLNFLRVQYIFVSNNKLTGEIPSSICNASSLEILDLSHNNLSGTVPKRISAFFLGPQRHRTPFVAELVGVVAVEIKCRPKIPFPLAIWFLIFAWLGIKCPVTCKVDASDVSEHIKNLCALEYLKTPKLTVFPYNREFLCCITHDQMLKRLMSWLVIMHITSEVVA